MNATSAGRSFKKLRERAGLSRKEAATALGVTVNGLYYWELNRSFPKPKLWDDLINLYGLKRSELIRLAGGKDSPRVRRYLSQQQEHSKRQRRRIYLRPEQETVKKSTLQVNAPLAQKTEQTALMKRIDDLELQVSKLQDSIQIIERMHELLHAWRRFKNGLEVR